MFGIVMSHHPDAGVSCGFAVAVSYDCDALAAKCRDAGHVKSRYRDATPSRHHSKGLPYEAITTPTTPTSQQNLLNPQQFLLPKQNQSQMTLSQPYQGTSSTQPANIPPLSTIQPTFPLQQPYVLPTQPIYTPQVLPTQSYQSTQQSNDLQSASATKHQCFNQQALLKHGSETSLTQNQQTTATQSSPVSSRCGQTAIPPLGQSPGRDDGSR